MQFLLRTRAGSLSRSVAVFGSFGFERRARVCVCGGSLSTSAPRSRGRRIYRPVVYRHNPLPVRFLSEGYLLAGVLLFYVRVFCWGVTRIRMAYS